MACVDEIHLPLVGPGDPRFLPWASLASSTSIELFITRISDQQEAILLGFGVSVAFKRRRPPVPSQRKSSLEAWIRAPASTLCIWPSFGHWVFLASLRACSPKLGRLRVVRDPCAFSFMRSMKLRSPIRHPRSARLRLG